MEHSGTILDWKKKPSANYDVLVALDGSGDYTSIQKAIDGTKSFPYERITIFVKNGVYKEKVVINAWNPNISLVGESKENTIKTFDDHFKKIDRGRNSTFFTYSLLVEGNDSKDKDATRFTNPHTSYRHNLMRFVIESREKGAYPSCSLPL
ncbi:MAG: hypothetical protein KDC85_09155 [Saprospiraceae bacterium]|nr:hypothetical protein [Saprospiraceae bacterium]MCB9326659.1 hypothetical protein [Lewinellaceae bacterium]